LFCVDIFGNSIFRYVPKSNELFEVSVGQGTKEGDLAIGGPYTSLVIPVEGQPDKFLISMGRDAVIMEWDGKAPTPKSMKKVFSVDEHQPKNKFNDGKCDAKGQLWAGTMNEVVEPGVKVSAFYHINLDGKIQKKLENIGVSNGLVWSPDNKVFYYVDSFTYKVQAFDFDLETGNISNGRSVYDFKANGEQGFPDGMTIDSNGNLWISNAYGWKVLHVDPKTGKKIGQIEFPTCTPTSVAFGGPNLDVLYVTSGDFMIKTKEEHAKNQLLEDYLL